MLRCTASFVIAAYDNYASFLRICTPCLRTFYEVVQKSTFYEGINYIPVKNISMDIETEERIYKLIRLNDDQFYLLYKNSISIFEDYTHLMSLSMDKDIIYSSFSKMYITWIFNECL